uniref:Uncharacterized protein n=1 Tax=Salix viminalis TaxID=40686 RepID=A0A6N2LBU9_SALVM
MCLCFCFSLSISPPSNTVYRFLSNSFRTSAPATTRIKANLHFFFFFFFKVLSINGVTIFSLCIIAASRGGQQLNFCVYKCRKERGRERDLRKKEKK